MSTYVMLKTLGLLLCSNFFMTFAWYGHLKFPSKNIVLVIAISWGIALFEYCFQVPANRLGITAMTAAQLKVLQEAITFSVFVVFSIFYLKQRPTLYDALAFAFIVLAVAVSMLQPSAKTG